MTRREDESLEGQAKREAEHRRGRLERMAGNIAGGLVSHPRYSPGPGWADSVADDAVAVAEAIMRRTRGG